VLIEHFQGDIRQQWGENPALRGAGVRFAVHLVFTEDSRFQERFHQTKDAAVTDTATDPAHQRGVVALRNTP
jgi:hypothetical protein